ncbi:hypothetical protein [Sphingomonas arenae]|uniref:hypothetical protein n=1 Tax=Sphingomonas arenae TaxID=2812555 RepID=UPI001967D3D5|nr:hypothetical protein [Sphingomonas arenae]
MIAFEAKPSWLQPGTSRREAAGKKGSLDRNKVSAILLGGVVATLVAAGATPPASAAPRSDGQAGWSGKTDSVEGNRRTCRVRVVHKSPTARLKRTCFGKSEAAEVVRSEDRTRVITAAR